MASDQQNTYDITLDKSLLLDPTFQKGKNYSEFFPLKFKTILSRQFEELSPSSRTLLIYLLAISYEQQNCKFQVTEQQLPKYRSISINQLFLELSNSNYLQCPNIYKDTNIQSIDKDKYPDLINQSGLPTVFKPSKSRDLIKITNVYDLSQVLSNSIKNNFLQMYGEPDFIKQEFFKMVNWLENNPRKNNKTTRGWGVFVSGWLDRGWPNFQKSIQSNKAKASSVEELMSFMGWDNA